MLQTGLIASLDLMSRGNEHEVVIVGGGPTGLMLGAELTLAGVDAVVIERRPTTELEGSRAGGLHIRTLEVLDQRGIVEPFLAAGQTYPSLGYAYIQLDVTDHPTRHSHLLALKQNVFEPMLADWAQRLGVDVRRGREAADITVDDDGVELHLADGESLRGRFLVGCDGGRSLVRRTARIDFAGVEASTSWLIAEAEMDATPPIGIRPEGGGIGPVDPTTDGGPYGIVLKEPDAERTAQPTIDELRGALVAAYGTDFGVHRPTALSSFTDASFQAVDYRRGRVLLAGDAAHIHAPLGGQGLNTGVQDAVNLGWKLARVLRGTSPDALLDTYHAERHPVGARVLENTMAQTALVVADERHRALHAAVARWLALDEPRVEVSAMISGLDIRYDTHDATGGDHPLVGRRMPDLDLHTSDGATRVFELLHAARPVLLDLGRTDGAVGDDARWPGVRVVRATADGPWMLPVIGEVAPVAGVLIRPDGHVAWAGDPGGPALTGALDAWFGRAG